MALENQRVIDNINAAQSQDTRSSDNNGGSSDSGSSSSSNDESNEDQKLFSDKNNELGSESRFILVAQDERIAMFEVIEGNEALDADLPHKIKPIAE
jgi:hypothetical protein